MHQLRIRLISIAIFYLNIMKNKSLVILKSLINIFHHNFSFSIDLQSVPQFPTIFENRKKTLFGRARKNFSPVGNFNKLLQQKVKFLVVLRHLSLKFYKILIFKQAMDQNKSVSHYFPHSPTYLLHQLLYVNFILSNIIIYSFKYKCI